MKTLSHREKVLLYILLLVGIFVLGWFVLVQPALTKQRALKNEQATITTTIESLKANKKDYSTLEQDSKNAADQYNGLVTRYYNTTFKTEDIDALFTQLTVDHGLTPLQLDISLTTSAPITTYGEELEEAVTSGTTENTIKTSSNTITREEGIALINEKKMICYTVTQRVRGISNNIYSYIDKINEDSGIRVNSMMATASTTKPGQYEATLTFNVYVMFK